ncbi:MAG TPA: hypothetical protein VJA94_13565 [Candidatus Angelobacter sp.]
MVGISRNERLYPHPAGGIAMDSALYYLDGGGAVLKFLRTLFDLIQ